MEKNGITVRDARPSDAPAIARLIVMAWPVDVFLEHGRERTVEDLVELVTDIVARKDTLYSYANTVVAEAVVEGVGTGTGSAPVVGAMVGYDGADLHRLRRPVEEEFARRFGATDMKWSDETQAGEFYFDSVAVDPAYRGCGIGSSLFEAMSERARSMGYPVAGLLVDFDNPSAEKLYTRLGFRTVGGKDFFGHSMKHMQKNL